MAPFHFPWDPYPWENQEVFNGTVTSEVGLYAVSATNLFNAFAQTLGVGYGYIALGFYFIGGRLSNSGALFVSIITFLSGGLSKPSFHPV